MSIPHIVKTSEDQNGNNWCVHYAGFFAPGASMAKKTHCKAGVEYASVAKQAAFTHAYEHSPGSHYTNKQAHPCFKCETHLTDGCPKQQFHTKEENAARTADAESYHQKINVARETILQDLRRRWKEDKGVGITAPVDISRFHQPQTNYFCGAGEMACPICRTGKLQYSRSSYNGHVRAQCSTNNCVAWIE